MASGTLKSRWVLSSSQVASALLVGADGPNALTGGNGTPHNDQATRGNLQMTPNRSRVKMTRRYAILLTLTRSSVTIKLLLVTLAVPGAPRHSRRRSRSAGGAGREPDDDDAPLYR